MKTNGRDTQDIKEMVLRVLNEKDQWSKHVAHTCCKCEKCTCGKHKCKLSPPKFELKTGNTTYNQSFQLRKNHNTSQQKFKPNTCSYHPKQFINKSEYRQKYNEKKAKQENAKPQKRLDNIEIGGPNFSRTSYQDSYTPKHNSKTSMIKNPENMAKFGTRMNGTSHYKETYNGRKSRVEQPIRQKDNLKTEHVPFTGTTTYGLDFSRMKPYKKDHEADNFAPNRQYYSTHGMRPKSQYRCDYGQKKIIRCPAQSCC